MLANALPDIQYNPNANSDLINVTTYHITSRLEYLAFVKRISSIVGANCNAMTENNNIVFNLYKTKSIRHYIKENNIRISIANNPRDMFDRILKKKEDFQVEIYMFPWEKCYKIIIDYSIERRTILVRNFIYG